MTVSTVKAATLSDLELEAIMDLPVVEVAVEVGEVTTIISVVEVGT